MKASKAGLWQEVVMEKILELYGKFELGVLCGIELEFYAAKPPVGLSLADSVKSEDGSGQFEAIFDATPNLAELCRKVRGFRQNSEFDFAAKPRLGQPSSSMQFNLSFSGATPLLLGQIMAGMLASLVEATAFLTKNANCFERLQNRDEAAAFRNSPTAICYGMRANRTAALRLLNEEGARYFLDGKPLTGYRIEHRVPSPLVCPELALWVILMGGLYGLKNKLEPGEPIYENAFESAALRAFPSSKREAFRLYKNGGFRSFIKQTLYEK